MDTILGSMYSIDVLHQDCDIQRNQILTTVTLRLQVGTINTEMSTRVENMLEPKSNRESHNGVKA